MLSEMLHADDIVLWSDIIEDLWKWKKAFESNGMKANLMETQWRQ